MAFFLMMCLIVILKVCSLLSKVEIDKIFIGEKFSIMDQLGKIIFEGEIKNNKIEIDISHLSNGLYFLKFGRKTAQFIRIVKG